MKTATISVPSRWGFGLLAPLLAAGVRAQGMCDSLADASTYDLGAPNSTVLRTDEPAPDPVIGGSVKLIVESVPPGSSTILGINPGQVLTSIPGWPLPDELLINPIFTAVTAPVSSPSPEWTFDIPPDSSLAGFHLYAQAAHLTPTLNLLLSNGVDLKFGYAMWDLGFSLVNPPSAAVHCGSTSWTVRVKNHGNVPSPAVCALSGIAPFAGPGQYDLNLGLNFFTVPPLAPGQTWNHSVGTYFIPCFAFQQPQYIKAEINYAAGCFDLCTNAPNYVQASIDIL